MELNEIFYIDKYTEARDFAEKNGYAINEIEKDNDGKRQFKISIPPKLTEKELLELELNNLTRWFDVYYMQHEQKYRRLYTLKILTDDDKDPYAELLSLYQEAEIKRKRIQEIENILNINSLNTL